MDKQTIHGIPVSQKMAMPKNLLANLEVKYSFRDASELPSIVEADLNAINRIAPASQEEQKEIDLAMEFLVDQSIKMK